MVTTPHSHSKTLSLPPSMPETPSLFAPRCDSGGVYSTCFDQFSKANESLSRIDFPDDFVGQMEPWFGSDNFSTRFFRQDDSTNELVVTLFGEVLDEGSGTGLGALGGSAQKRSRNQVTLPTLYCQCIPLLTHHVVRRIQDPRRPCTRNSYQC